MLAKDPVKRGLNGYPYCDNDPADYVDPTGEVPNIIAGGIIGGIAGGIAGFLESSVSQIWNKEKYSLRKALGAAAKGAITGASQGALMASGAGLAKTGAKLATSLLTNFGAGFLGSMAEQKINKRRVNPREAIREGLNNSIGGALFGNSPISGLKNAIIRGARSNAAVAAINNIFDSFTPTEQDRIHDFMLNLPPGTTLVLELPGMRDDPRNECGGKNPFHDGVGYALPSATGRYNSDTNGGRKGFSLVDFLKDVAAGAVLGGLSGAVYYGGGKAVEAVKGSVPKNKTENIGALKKVTISDSNELYSIGNTSRNGNTYTKKEIISLIEGKTRQSTKIANALRAEKIKLNMLDDKLFENYLGVDKNTSGIAIRDLIYVRHKSNHILSDIVHEGTHALDYNRCYGWNGLPRWAWEKRAYFYERQFQIAMGSRPDFATISDMLVHIWGNYKNEIYNPYKNNL